ncbi:CHAT domain-containing protein [Amycolatopsis sp. NPDC058278]|uniref:CHAT domain-containing protein n=1 Tax=Amycolatopsis sp. NPDC058278 TaxID=3346417 RepID=UPI0036D9B33F
MSEQDAVAELARLWDLLPMLVGGPWDELEPLLTDALEALRKAGTDGDSHRLAGEIMRLCLPYPSLRAALATAYARHDYRTDTETPVVPWKQTAHEVATSLARSARPGGERWLTAEVQNHPPATPWRVGVAQVLTIAVAAGDDRPPDAPDIPDHALSGTGEDGAVLTVELRGDADIETLQADLVLPPAGPSPDRARFRVTPHPGVTRLILTAVVTRKDTRAFIQVITLDVTIVPDDLSPPVSVRGLRERAIGWPLDEAFGTDGADATLVVTDRELLLVPHGLSAWLPASRDDLLKFGEVPRRALRAIVRGLLEEDDGDPVHQRDIGIPQAEYERAMTTLVDAGTLMFNSLFGAAPDLAAIGKALAMLPADHGPLRVEITARDPVIPWHLLGFPRAEGTVADPSQIFGLRHRIAYVPRRSGTRRPPPSENLRLADGPLRVVLALNRDIDTWRGVRRDLTELQLTNWLSRERAADGALTVAVPAEGDVVNVLLGGLPPAELVYFFCHAELDEDPLGIHPVTAALGLTSPHKVSLRDLLTRWTPDQELDLAPLIVLNACATAVPPDQVYAAFTPWLMAKGARGVIGTEVEIPAVFAAAWATEFFQDLLDGVPVADAAFRVTRHFVDRHHNLLGLAYALHCNGRSRIAPAVPGPHPNRHGQETRASRAGGNSDR